jgi:RNA methyltransferase, TrmH family
VGGGPGDQLTRRLVISSNANKQVAAVAKLTKRGLREKERRFLTEGAQSTEEALDAGAVETLLYVAPPAESVDRLVAMAESTGVRVVSITEQVMAHLTSTVTPQGILAVARFIDVPLAEIPERSHLVPILYAVRDPGNAGTVLRSADAAGADAIVFTDSSVDVYNPKTVRASAGSLFHLPVVRDVPVGEAVDSLRQRGLRVVAATADGEAAVYETNLNRPTAVLFGNEAWGLPPEVTALADESVRIPIRGRSESLNLAAAAALFMFESARQRDAASGDSIGSVISASAHDVRSALTTVKGFAGTLSTMWDRLDEADRRMIVGALTVDAERATALVKMLVDAARVEQGAFGPSPELHDVAEDAEWVRGAFAQSPEHPDLRVSGGGEALFDPERLQALLFTLCAEAIGWGREGAIHLRIEPADRGIAVEVHRAGGITTTQEVQASFARPRPGGKGRIALWLARTLAEAQGGALTWDATDGVRFRLLLPR